MQYDFDTQINRRNTDSLKWNVGESELPMWVADMDFQTAPEILEEIKKVAEHGVFGYTEISELWYESIINWWKRRHNLVIKKDWLIFSIGIVPALSSIIRRLSSVGDNVLVQTPVYNIFFNCIQNNGRHILENELKYVNDAYYMDFEDLERKLSHPQTTLMILCNPHNPIGKIWDKDTLLRMGELCYKHNVVVISDEIHCDLTQPKSRYTPFASVSEICAKISVTCISPTKTFNLAGLQTSAVFVENEGLRHKVFRGLNSDEIAEPNAFAIAGAVAAFSKGEPWLDELCEYIYKNKCFVQEFLENELPQIKLVESSATYLLWLDCTGLMGDTVEFSEQLRKSTGLYISLGANYGKGGYNFIRMNIACPKETVKDGLIRLKKYAIEYEKCEISWC